MNWPMGREARARRRIAKLESRAEDICRGIDICQPALEYFLKNYPDNRLLNPLREKIAYLKGILCKIRAQRDDAQCQLNN